MLRVIHGAEPIAPRPTAEVTGCLREPEESSNAYSALTEKYPTAESEKLFRSRDRSQASRGSSDAPLTPDTPAFSFSLARGGLATGRALGLIRAPAKADVREEDQEQRHRDDEGEDR